MGARMRALDWSRPALGPIETWPQSLRSTVSMLLPSKAQIILFWGPEFIVLYNDAYRPVFGAKHPHALGLPGREAWSEIWDSQLHELLAGVVRTGEAFWAKDLLFELERHGFPEETYFDVSYDPVRVESGDVGGVYCIVTETTERVVGERRLALLRRPRRAQRGARARPARPACWPSRRWPATRRTSCSRSPISTTTLQSEHAGRGAELAPARPELVKELAISSSTPAARRGRLVVGLNPRRPFDDQYRGVRRAGRRPARHRARRTRGPTRRSAARRSARRARSRQDGVLQQRQSRVPHAADADARAARRRCSPHDDRCRRARASGATSCTATRCACCKLVNTLLDFSRIEAGRVEAVVRADRPGRAARPSSPARFGRRSSGGPGARRRLRAARRAGLRRPRHVGEDRPESALERVQVHVRGRDPRRAARRRTPRRAARRATPGSAFRRTSLPRLFERFHRVEGARARTHEGTGIGLALVQELVRLHGGDDHGRQRGRPRHHVHGARSRAGTRASAGAIGAARRRRPGDGARRDAVRRGSAALAAGERRPRVHGRGSAVVTAAGRSRTAAGLRARRRRQRGHARVRPAPPADAAGDVEARRATVAPRSSGRAARMPDLVLADVMMPDARRLRPAARRSAPTSARGRARHPAVGACRRGGAHRRAAAPAPTTTSSSRSARASCSPASRRSWSWRACGARRSRRCASAASRIRPSWTRRRWASTWSTPTCVSARSIPSPRRCSATFRAARSGAISATSSTSCGSSRSPTRSCSLPPHAGDRRTVRERGTRRPPARAATPPRTTTGASIAFPCRTAATASSAISATSPSRIRPARPKRTSPRSSTRPTTRSSPRISTASSSRATRPPERLFGYTSDELVGQPVRMLIPARAAVGGRRHPGAAAAGERVEHFETVRVTKDGRRIECRADDVAGARRRRHDHRRVEDRARHHRAEARGGRTASAAHARTRDVTETLNNVGAIVASDLDRDKVVQAVTDAATELTTAEFGAFFYNVVNDSGESYTLYTISGVPREAFSKFPMPRNTEVFEPTFKGTGVVRSDDITKDPRYGHNAPHHGMPAGHLPVRSYLAVPVKGRDRATSSADCSSATPRSAASPSTTNGSPIGVASWASVALENARPVRERAGGQPPQGRIPRHPLARAADAAQRHPRLRAHAAVRHRRARQARQGDRDDRAQRHVADADRRGRARRLAHRLGQAAAERAAGRAAGDRSERASTPSGRRPTPRACGSRRSSIPAPRRSPAIRNGCSRSCGTCCRTP